MILTKTYHISLNQGLIFEKSQPQKNLKTNFNDILDFYTIKKGDNLYNIVKKYLKTKYGKHVKEANIIAKVKEIAKNNNIKNPNKIYPGQIIFLEAKEKYRLPVKGIISSGYGIRLDPFTHTMRFHHGVDIAAPVGTPIEAFDDGVVIFSGEQKGYGNIIILQHSNGIITKYAHNSQNFVKKGDIVSKGEIIGLVGNTGRSTGPHLHFEVKVKNKTVNPLMFINV